jgi:hypothetical protein
LRRGRLGAVIQQLGHTLRERFEAVWLQTRCPAPAAQRIVSPSLTGPALAGGPQTTQTRMWLAHVAPRCPARRRA